MEKIVPIHIISGFLGSGKTTLLKKALDYYKESGRKRYRIHRCGQSNGSYGCSYGGFTFIESGFKIYHSNMHIVKPNLLKIVPQGNVPNVVVFIGENFSKEAVKVALEKL